MQSHTVSSPRTAGANERDLSPICRFIEATDSKDGWRTLSQIRPRGVVHTNAGRNLAEATTPNSRGAVLAKRARQRTRLAASIGVRILTGFLTRLFHEPGQLPQ